MGRRLERMMREHPVLLVSLPRNDLTLAQAAVAGGAQGLKVHLNVEHRASGTRFGAWPEEAPRLAPILDLGVPVGMVPGTGGRMITPEEAAEIEAAGVDFVDTYLQDMPAWLSRQAREMSVMAALGWQDADTGWDLGPLAGQCQLLEASVVRPAGYGAALAEEDLSAYREIAARYPDLPAVVPTQRALRSDQVDQVLATGMRGILIGAIVTGAEPEGIRHVTEQFARALAAG